MSTNPYGGSTDETETVHRTATPLVKRHTWRRTGLVVLLVAVGVGGFLTAGAMTTSQRRSGSRLRATPGFTVKINGVNMEPSLEPGEKISASVNFEPDGLVRGEIVLFNKPPDNIGPGVTNVVDRIVGLPGETISSSGGEVHINGKPLREPWLVAAERDATSDFGPTEIPRGEYFVLGDNRGDMGDSRLFGPIPSDVILGVAIQVISPPSRTRTLTP
jgi:signal peptidase I